MGPGAVPRAVAARDREVVTARPATGPVAGAGGRSDVGVCPLWTSWLVLPARP